MRNIVTSRLMNQAPEAEQLAAQESLTHEELIEAVHPSIELVRREIFGREAVPFPTLSKAVEWIEGALPPENPLSLKQWRGLVQRVKDATDGLGVVSFESPSVAYWKPGSRTALHVGAAPGSPHATLGAQAREISDATGWRAAEVVMWILADREPDPVPRVHYRVNWRITGLPTGGNLHRKTVVLEVYDPDLTDTEWRRVLKGIRKEFRRDRKRSLPKEDHILYDVVHEVGSEAAEGETWAAHWDAIARECNHRSGNPTWFKNHRSPYMRWRRLRTKLQEIQEHSWRPEPTQQPQETS